MNHKLKKLKKISSSENAEYSPIAKNEKTLVVVLEKLKLESPKKKPNKLNEEYCYKKIQGVLRPPCTICRLGCSQRVDEEVRKINLTKFWEKLKTCDERRIFIRSLVDVQLISLINRKKFNRKYHLEIENGTIEVCKTMFFNTLAISNTFLANTLQMYPENDLEENEITLFNNSKDKIQIDSINNQEFTPVEILSLDIKSKKDLKPSCTCLQKCYEKVPEENRFKIYTHFWKQLNDYEERKRFLVNTVLYGKHSPQKFFILPIQGGLQIPVCKTMYLNTLGLTGETISLILPVIKKGNKRKSNNKENTESKKIKLEHPLLKTCSCILQCSKKLSKKIRARIHTEFWNLPTKVDRKHFILSTLQLHPKRRKTEHLPREIKKFLLPFRYGHTKVCKKIYLNTLTVSEKFIHNTLKNINLDGQINDEVEEEEDDDDDVDAGNDEEEEDKEVDENEPILLIENDEDISDNQDYEEKLIAEEMDHFRGSIYKIMGPPCSASCRFQCCTKFTKDNRQKLYTMFWEKLSWQEQKQFVRNTVEEVTIKRNLDQEKFINRAYSRVYSLPVNENDTNNIIVCQKMYFNTLSICSKFVLLAHIWASQIKW